MEECPEGYPRLGAFLDSDEGFSIYRRFGYVEARLLLEKQDEMRRLEQELKAMDERDENLKSKRLVTRTFEPTRDILQKLETTYHEYGIPTLSGPLKSIISHIY